MTREALLAEAMRLPVEERRALARELLDAPTDNEASNPDIDSADIDSADTDAAWEIELTRRRTLLDAGKLKLYPWEQVRAELYDESDDEDADDAASLDPVIRHATR
ncbi:MAG: addiction module protein [Myxococcales bacterium]|nr:addiction module protein [Myxococcales bacterium]